MASAIKIFFLSPLLAFFVFCDRNEVESLEKEVQLMKQRLQKMVSQRNKLRYVFNTGTKQEPISC